MNISLRIVLISVICVLFSSYGSFSQCPGATALTIDGVTTTESRCQASGTATVAVSGGVGPYMYSITIGPVLLPPQSSNVLQSLEAGNYTVQVKDFCNTVITKTFTVAGTYTVLQPWTTIKNPDCQGYSDGKIKIDVTNGRPPYKYALISPSPVTVSPQAGNEFTGLPGGDYTYQVTDSCDNYQTRQVTLLSNDNGNFQGQLYSLHYEGCDSFSMAYTFTPDILFNFKAPYTVTLTLPDGTNKVKVIPASAIISGTVTFYDTLYFRYHHIMGNTDLLQVNIVNNCGQALPYPMGYGMTVLDMYPSYLPGTGCPLQYRYTFDQNKDNNPAEPWLQYFHCNTITYTLLDPAWNILASQVNNSTFSNFPVANGYKVIREDCCRKDTLYFDWAAPPALKINNYSLSTLDVKKDNTVSLNLMVYPYLYGRVVVASGPPSVTFLDGTVHNYTYPDTLFNQPFGTTSVNINYLTVGDYKVYALDSCGNKDSLSFTITPAEVRHDTFSTSLIKGCLGANKIRWRSTITGYQYAGSSYATVYMPNLGQLQYSNASPDIDSFVNINTGTYIIEYTYWDRFFQQGYLKGMSGYTNDKFIDTIVVPPYTQPSFAANPAIAVCAGDRHVALLPDSTKGVLPFKYRIAAGSVTTSLQSSPVFSHLAMGTYKLLMEDACGNSYSRDMTVDTLSVPGIATNGSTCQNDAATLTLPSWPYYTYSWQLPDGTIYAGDSLAIDPVTPADTGLYRITVTSNIAGCVDSKTSAATLRFCSALILPLNILQFSGTQKGEGFLLNWRTANEENTRHFTIERNAANGDFIRLGQTNATGLASSTYSFMDYQPLAGVSKYRLLITDQDGKNSYSKTIVRDGRNALKPDVYPRMITGRQPVYVVHPPAVLPAIVQVLNMQGVVLRNIPVTKGAVQTIADLGTLPAGSYLVVYNHQSRYAVKVLKL